MFKELLPLLRQRAVLMTVCVVEDGSLRVNIMPKKTGTEDAAKAVPTAIQPSQRHFP